MTEFSLLLLPCILAVLFGLNSASAFTATPSTQLQMPVALLPKTRTKANNSASHSYRLCQLFLSESDRIDVVSENEFSRTVSVSQWFSGGGGSLSSKRNRKKKMDLSISATPEECRDLATRFRLTNIAALSADLAVQPALGGDDSECIEASGTIFAEVTQTCVRTNEAFDVSLEFSFDTVLRAMTSRSGSGADEDEELTAGELEALNAASKLESGRSQKKKAANKRSGTKGIRGGQSINDMGMKQLQDTLMEYEVTDDIVEDENCFCTDGNVDCGEIVAQMFRSNLDPYPKKPGSDPVSYSFTF